MEKDENLVLVGLFYQNRPPIDEIKAGFQKLFPVGRPTHVGAVDVRSILLSFVSEEDCLSVLSRGQAVVVKSVRFVRWTPDCRRRRAVVPVWILLPGLPYHLFNLASLSHICAPIGRVLGLDVPTQRRTCLSVARVRIEVDLRRDRIDKIRLEIWNEKGEISGFWQKIVYDALPELCSSCGVVGHGAALCSKGGRQEGEAVRVEAMMEEELEVHVAEVVEAATQVVMEEVAEAVMKEGLAERSGGEVVGLAEGCGLENGGPDVGGLAEGGEKEEGAGLGFGLEAGMRSRPEGGLGADGLVVGPDAAGLAVDKIGLDEEKDVKSGFNGVGIDIAGPSKSKKKKRRAKANSGVGPGVQTRSMKAIAAAQESNLSTSSINNYCSDFVGLKSTEIGPDADPLGVGFNCDPLCRTAAGPGTNFGLSAGPLRFGINSKFFGLEADFEKDPMVCEFNLSGVKGRTIFYGVDDGSGVIGLGVAGPVGPVLADCEGVPGPVQIGPLGSTD